MRRRRLRWWCRIMPLLLQRLQDIAPPRRAWGIPTTPTIFTHPRVPWTLRIWRHTCSGPLADIPATHRSGYWVFFLWKIKWFHIVDRYLCQTSSLLHDATCQRLVLWRQRRFLCHVRYLLSDADGTAASAYLLAVTDTSSWCSGTVGTCNPFLLPDVELENDDSQRELFDQCSSAFGVVRHLASLKATLWRLGCCYFFTAMTYSAKHVIMCCKILWRCIFYAFAGSCATGSMSFTFGHSSIVLSWAANRGNFEGFFSIPRGALCASSRFQFRFLSRKDWQKRVDKVTVYCMQRHRFFRYYLLLPAED